MPRVVRVGSKSGVLPRPRQVVPEIKALFEQEHIRKIPTHFEDPSMAPRGSSAAPPGRTPMSVAERISRSSKAPQKQKNSSATASQAWKEHISQVRRAYFADSLKAYERAEQQAAEFRQKRRDMQQEEHEALSTQLKESAATLLTMPSIEESLRAGAMVQPRTEEQQAELQLKRAQNRLQTEREQRERLNSQVLELYHGAHSFILSTDELSRKVDSLFGASSNFQSGQIAHLRSHMAVVNVEQGVKEARARDQEQRTQRLSDALTGTLNGSPGLEEVRDALQAAEARNTE